MSELEHRANTHMDKCDHWDRKPCSCRMEEASKELAAFHTESARMKEDINYLIGFSLQGVSPGLLTKEFANMMKKYVEGKDNGEG